MTPLDTFFETLAVYGDRYVIPKTWELPRVLGRDSWRVAYFMPDLKRVPLRFLSYRGEFRWNNRANGLHTRLQPGEVAVVKATFGNK